jgi:UDP-N-acetylmuramoyl-tripeptide--D-alanyl-D-alanine ligase
MSAMSDRADGVNEAALDLEFVLSATGGSVFQERQRRPARSFTGVAIDGRAVPAGGLWFAIQGERFDGHDFAAQAVASGAAGLVVARGRARSLPSGLDATVIEVGGTVRALGDLARAHRLRLPSLEVVGVTGSNGKTTTKEMVAAILAAHAGSAAVHKTEGNFNNHLGLPLTLLRLGPAHRYAVIEMGMSALGEIAYLAGLALPDVGIIVNVGPVHLATLGSIDNIARAKGELFAALGPAGIAVYPDGDERIAAQAEASRAVRQLRFGTGPGVPVRLLHAHADLDGTAVKLRLPDGRLVQARVQAVGLHNARNAVAAAAAAHALGVAPEAIARGLSESRAAKHRSTVVEIGGRRVIDDCYNASPLSTAAALDTLGDLARQHKRRAVAVLGDMLELGPDEALLHRNIGERAGRLGLDLLVAVGPRAEHIAEGAYAAGMGAERVIHTEDVRVAVGSALHATQPGDFILVKASRGARLERVVDGLRAEFAAPSSAGVGGRAPSGTA